MEIIIIGIGIAITIASYWQSGNGQGEERAGGGLTEKGIIRGVLRLIFLILLCFLVVVVGLRIGGWWGDVFMYSWCPFLALWATYYISGWRPVEGNWNNWEGDRE